MSKITALIHLRALSAHANSKYGRFLRPDKPPHPKAERLHLWLGREITVDEFDREFAAAVASVQHTTDRVFATLIVRPDDAEIATAGDVEALKATHAEQIALIQSGVNDFTAEMNQKFTDAQADIESKAARIVELERLLAERPLPAQTETSIESPPVESIDKAGADEAPPVEGNEAPAPGAGQVPDSPSPSPKTARKKGK